LRDKTGLDFCDRSWICNATKVSLLCHWYDNRRLMHVKAKH